jgi:hypothetical protein
MRLSDQLGLLPDPGLAAEFHATPFGPHSSGLVRLLVIMRSRLFRPWLAALPEDSGFRLIAIGERGEPPVLLDDRLYPDLAAVERAAFDLRWQILFDREAVDPSLGRPRVPRKPRLLGYCGDWTCQPGQELTLHISAPVPTEATLTIERLICGDAARGIRVVPIDDIPARQVMLSAQPIRPGSCLAVADLTLAGRDLQFDLRPGLLRDAAILGWNGQALLKLSAVGWVGLGECWSVPILRALVWSKVDLSVAATGLTVTVTTGRRTAKVAMPGDWSGAGKLTFGAVLDGDGFPALPFDGRIGGIVIRDDSGTFCQPDIAGDPASARVADFAVPGHRMQLVNLPTRAVPGRHWDGGALQVDENPAHYDALHFHRDDLEDARLPEAARIRLPDNLPSAIYIATIRAGDLALRMPFHVVPKASCKPVVFLASTMTYHAYANTRIALDSPEYEISELQSLPVIDDLHLGLMQHPEVGASHYDRHPDGHAIYLTTRRRPVLNLAPETPVWAWNADTHITAFLTDQTDGFDVLTDDRLDVEGLEALNGARVVVTGTHPEYVTDRVWDALAAFTARGGRLIYLGGNGFYWRVEVPRDRPCVMEVRRAESGARYNEPDPGEEHFQTSGRRSGLYRRLGRPPQALVGVGMVADGWDSAAGYRLTEAATDPRAAFLFDGVEGTVIGAPCRHHSGAAGQELDCADVRLGTPRHALVLASSFGHSSDYVLAPEEVPFIHPGVGGDVSPRVRADLTFFETEGGGAVLSTGSIAWASTMQAGGEVSDTGRVILNAIRRFADPAPFLLPEEFG